jgi:hypothetical protein
MDLKEFVKEALVQVSSGVREAQEQVRTQGGYVNPSVVSSAVGQTGASHFGTLNSGQHVLLMEFDTQKGDGGIKL